MRFLVAGLGNIGEKYHDTRHNIGFSVLDYIAKKNDFSFESKRYAFVAKHRIKNKIVFFIKPTTYMNLSGNALRYWKEYLKLPNENILVITDDISLPFGKIRIRARGSDGGHNGLVHITNMLNSMEFPRLRFGIGNNYPKGTQAEYVLSTWNEEEYTELPDYLEKANLAISSFVLEGINQSMTKYNK